MFLTRDQCKLPISLAQVQCVCLFDLAAMILICSNEKQYMYMWACFHSQVLLTFTWPSALPCWFQKDRNSAYANMQISISRSG